MLISAVRTEISYTVFWWTYI